jgi:hypothetical protein
MKFSTRRQRQEFDGGFALVRTAGEAVRSRIRTGRRLLIQWFPAEKWKPTIRRKIAGKRGVS